MRIFIDTNVCISQLPIPHSVSDRAVLHVAQNHELAINDVLFAKLSQTLKKPKLAKLLSAELRQYYLALLCEKIGAYTIRKQITACRDPKDNMVLELAVAAKASYIITGDQDLLCLNPFNNIEIITLGCYTVEDETPYRHRSSQPLSVYRECGGYCDADGAMARAGGAQSP